MNFPTDSLSNFQLWSRQFKQLFLTVYRSKIRNKSSTLGQLFVPIWMTFILVILHIAFKPDSPDLQPPSTLPPILPLTPLTDFCSAQRVNNQNQQCYDLVISPNTNLTRDLITKTLSFLSTHSLADLSTVNIKYFPSDQDTVHWYNTTHRFSSDNVNLGIAFTNLTAAFSSFELRISPDRIFNDRYDYLNSIQTFQYALELTLQNSNREAVALPPLEMNFSTSTEPAFSRNGTQGTLMSYSLAPYYLLYMWQGADTGFLYVLFEEFSTNTPQLLSLVGMFSSAYFSAHFSVFLLQTAVSALIVVFLCIIGNFVSFFSSVLKLFLLFILFKASVFPLCFIATRFIKNPDKANGTTFMFYMTSMTLYGIASFNVYPNENAVLSVIFSLFSPVAYSRGLFNVFNTENNAYRHTDVTVEYYAFTTCVAFLCIDAVLYCAIAIFVEKWTQKHKKNTFSAVTDSARSLIDPDLPQGRTTVEVKSLYKSFPGNSRDSVHAVRNMSVSFNEHEIFALLGHNGAGKSTLSWVLAGAYPHSLVMNHPEITTVIKIYDRDLVAGDSISDILGICPQNDILFKYLTAEEHLAVYAAVKNISVPSSEYSALLSEISLANVYGKQQCISEYSGGMKRKLALLLSFLGVDRRFLILDEPTASMDPASRRLVWEAFQKIKKDKTILLVTHNMEEADILGDEIAIMSKGELQTLGTSLFLKRAFGIGYYLTIHLNTVESSCLDQLTEFCPGIKKISDKKSKTAQFILSEEDIKGFPEVFTYLKKEERVVSYGISQTTLEDVFLKSIEESEGNFEPAKEA